MHTFICSASKAISAGAAPLKVAAESGYTGDEKDGDFETVGGGARPSHTALLVQGEASGNDDVAASEYDSYDYQYDNNDLEEDEEAAEDEVRAPEKGFVESKKKQ